MESKSLKEYLIAQVNEVLTAKVTELKQALHDVQNSANSETKSTAGDKHETARAIAQQEVENLSRQLNEQLLESEKYHKALLLQNTGVIKAGSLVRTSQYWVYISCALGKIVVQHTPVFVISDQAPLAKVLLGRKAGEKISFNSSVIEVLEIC